MKQIYDFEQNIPPHLNENMLRQIEEKRRLQWQTAIIALAGILIQVIAVIIGVLAIDIYPVIAVFSFIYAIFSAIGCGVIAVICSRKGVFELCEE